MSGNAGEVSGGSTKGLAGKSRRHQNNLPDVEVQHRFSRTDQLLVSAARDGDHGLVVELLSCTHTFNINARDRKSGSTALVVAAAWGHAKIVSILLDKGADPTLHNFEGHSALEVAATTEITLLLLSCLPKSSCPSTLLQQAAWQGNVPLVEQVLCNDDKVDLEACNGEGLNALLLSARDVKVFQALYQQNLLNNYDPSEVVRCLLNSGANINHKDQQGRTALHYSVTNVSEFAVKVTKLLLKYNADPNAIDKHSFTPLHFAVKSKSLEATEILLVNGADVNKQTYAGHTALHIAASHGDVKLAATLLANKADVAAVTNSGLSPLKCSANREMYTLLKAAIGATVIESSPSNECRHYLRDGEAFEEHNEGKDDLKACRKSRNGRRHKSSNSVKKQLLFTMHLGLAVSKSPNGNELPGNSAQSRESSSNPKPLSAPPARSSPSGLPSRIPINVAKFGSGDLKGGASSPLRSRSCTNCEGISAPVSELEENKEGEIHSDSSDEGKVVSAIPDVLRTSSNLPLCGKNLRKHRRYVVSNPVSSPSSGVRESLRTGNREVYHSRLSHDSPSRKNPGSGGHFRDDFTSESKKSVQSLYVILGNQSHRPPDSVTVADYQKMKKHPHYLPDSDLIGLSKPSVHFLIDSKQSSNNNSGGGRHRQRHKHPYSVSVRGCKRSKMKTAKSDSEVETTKSISPVKGQSIFPPSSSKSGSNASKIVSKLPRKCKDFGHPSDFSKDNSSDLLKGALIGHKISTKPSMSKVVDQFRAISLQVTPSESNSTLDTSISSDCVSQVSAASWIYVPNEDTPNFGRIHQPPSTLPGLSGNGLSHSNNDLRASSYWKDDLTTPIICEDDILIEDESPEHLYDCPLTPPPSLQCGKKHHHYHHHKNSSDTCCTLDSESDLFQWSSDSCPTPVGSLVPTIEEASGIGDGGCYLKKYEGKTEEECLAALQGESQCHQLSISWAKGKLLGKGAFGLVWCGLTDAGDLIAVKQVKLNAKAPQQAAEEYIQIQQEFQMLQKLQHRNIVSYLGTQLEGATVSIFMQYLSGGSLAHNLTQFGQFAETVISRYSKQILEGIDYLHSRKIIHRDIKGANIMLMPSETGGLIKLIDFGCAKHLHMNLQDSSHYIQSVRGTPYWMAPEVIQQAGCTEKSDIWSIGATIIEMAQTKPPWHELPPFSAAYAIGQGTSKPKIPINLSPIAKDFIGSAMRRNPEARPMACDLLKHAFITETSVSSLEGLKKSDN